MLNKFLRLGRGIKILKMAEFYSIFVRMLFNIRLDICFEVKYSDLEPSFFLCLLFDLDKRALIFALTTNLKAGPRFARI